MVCFKIALDVDHQTNMLVSHHHVIIVSLIVPDQLFIDCLNKHVYYVFHSYLFLCKFVYYWSEMCLESEKVTHSDCSVKYNTFILTFLIGICVISCHCHFGKFIGTIRTLCTVCYLVNDFRFLPFT